MVSLLLAASFLVAARSPVGPPVDATSGIVRAARAAALAAESVPRRFAVPGPVVAGWEAVDPAALVAGRPEPLLVGVDVGAVPPRSVRSDENVGELSPVIADRRFATVDSPWLPIPATTEFRGSVVEVPDHVIRRSTWHEECPVHRDQLRWVRVTHVGFDGRAHAGELLVHESVADGMVEVFRRLYEARYPIERMRIAGPDHFRQHGWWHGADNGTGAFVCRQSTAGGKWSEHAYGLAIDINPYHNPYVKGDVVIPPGATEYLRRDDRPGIIHAHGDVRHAVADELGWYWGGEWSSALDYMHFSWNDW